MDPALLDLLTGDRAALVMALIGLFLFYKGRLLSPNVVPRKDYDAIVTIHGDYVEEFKPKAVDEIKTLTTERDALAEKLRAELARNGTP